VSGDHQHTVHRVAGHAPVRGGRDHAVRQLRTDGLEHRLFRWPVFRVHRRGVRTEAERHAHVGGERVLLRRFTDNDAHKICDHELAAHRLDQPVHPGHKYRRVVHGN